MAKIVQLKQHIADLIAAGEVVSRPASVVKELVENSIDAGASTITIEITGGGMSSIRVIDNGCGMEPQDAQTAFLRHATSKLQDASGLEAIGTLGFRGEALAAIAAVSRIELITRETSANEGVRLKLEAGKVLDFTPYGCPVGTTIIIRDLFFNTPARFKFMKTDRAEASAVSSVVLRCALSRPNLSFRYIKDGKTEFHTPGDSKSQSCIYSLLGRDFESELIPVDMSDNTISVEGFITKPSVMRGNRSYQFFFVNGRAIRSALLQSALEQAYKNTLMTGRFPACVLYINTSPHNVDVNVHPAKTEVRFVSDKQFFDIIYYAVLGALEKAVIMSHEQTQSETLTRTADFYTPAVSKTSIVPPVQHKPQSDKKIYPYRTGSERISSVEEFSLIYDASTPRVLPLPPYRIIGEVFDTYIVVERQDLDGIICFIDKHAAHERIHYDTLHSKKYTPMSEMLITPVICRTGCERASVLLENEPLLDMLGFCAEPFGEDALAVRSIPSDIQQSDVESVLTDICCALEQSGNAQSVQLDDIYKIIACKAAIKAGSSTDIQELDVLVRKVLSAEITTCPHGRPIVVEISKAALSRGTGRT